jgi:hypothetical protein
LNGKRSCDASAVPWPGTLDPGATFLLAFSGLEFALVMQESPAVEQMSDSAEEESDLLVLPSNCAPICRQLFRDA